MDPSITALNVQRQGSPDVYNYTPVTRTIRNGRWTANVGGQTMGKSLILSLTSTFLLFTFGRGSLILAAVFVSSLACNYVHTRWFHPAGNGFTMLDARCCSSPQSRSQMTFFPRWNSFLKYYNHHNITFTKHS